MLQKLGMYIDSMKDEIDLSGVEPFSFAGFGAGKEIEFNVDMNRMASSIFEKAVWPKIREKNQIDVNAVRTLEQLSDDYDEDYL